MSRLGVNNNLNNLGSYDSLYAGLPYALGINFMAGILPPSTTFTRSSNATQIDSLGRLAWAPHNLAPNPTGSGATITPLPTEINPFGQTEGVSRATATTTDPQIGNFTQTSSVLLSKACSYTVSCWVKAEGATIGKTLRFFMYRDGVTDVVTSSLVPMTGDWVRYDATLAFTTAPTTNWTVRLDIPDAGVIGDSVLFYGWQIEQADFGVPKDYINNGGVAYYAPRFDYDPMSLQRLGLLFEPQSTNLQPISMGTLANWSVSGLAAVSSTGTTILGNAAYTLTLSGNGFCFVGGSPGVFTASTRYTSSIRVKRGNHPRVQFTCTNNQFQPAVADAYLNYNFDTDTLTVGGSSLPAPTGTRKRCADGSVILTLSYTTGTTPTSGSPVIITCVDTDAAARLASTPTVGATVHFFGAQVEVGSVGTSYIPTFGTAATRAHEVCNLTPNCPWNSAGMSMSTQFSRYAIPESGVGTNICWFGGTTTDYWSFTFGTGTPSQVRLDMQVASVNEAQISQATTVVDTLYKLAGRLAPNDARLAQNGLLGTPDTLVTMLPTLSNARQAIGRGNAASGATQFYGHIRELKVFTTALSDAELQTLTS